MFGFVQANLSDLAKEERERYRAAYCGLCHALGERHGQLARLGLTYDLTFLILLLSSLYEPEETAGESRCIVHPFQSHCFFQNEITDYAADLTIALTYYKCLDDWQDEKALTKKCYGTLLKNNYQRVKSKWPHQCNAIENGIRELSQIENNKTETPDIPANCFGTLMSALFLYRKDRWEPYLREIGFHLGRYIYLADAAVDFQKDREKGSYNPLFGLSTEPKDLKPTLMAILGQAAEAFEFLPLVQDAHLLGNILYSGIWITYNKKYKNDTEATLVEERNEESDDR